jgi:hypothetical protein
MILLHGINWSTSTADMKNWVGNRLLQDVCSFILFRIRPLLSFYTLRFTNKILCKFCLTLYDEHFLLLCILFSIF